MIRNGSVRLMVTGPLAPFEAAFRVELARVGYTSRSARDLVQSMARLSRWLEGKALPVSGLTSQVTADLRAELPKLGPVLRFLRSVGALGETGVADAGPVEALLAEFRAWLAGERGLSAVTVRCY